MDELKRILDDILPLMSGLKCNGCRNSISFL